MSISVAIISSDMEYVTRLMSYMKGSPIYHTWRLQLYSSPERISQLAELERAQLIVVEESIYHLLLRRIEAGGGEIREHTLLTKGGVIPLIVLSSERRELASHELYKFQSLTTLLHFIQQRYQSCQSEGTKSLQITGLQSPCIAICSTLEQTGKTMLALHIAALLASKGYRVFYYNLERWNTSDYYLQETGASERVSYSDLLYLVKSKQNVKKWLADKVTALAKYGFYSLTPFQHDEDRQGLSSQDAQAILMAIAESGLYDFIIVDMPAGLDQWTLPILAQCAINFMVQLPKPSWQNKHRLAFAHAEQFEAHLMQQLQLDRWSIMNDLHGSAVNAGENAIPRPLECLPFVEAWQKGEPVLLSSASYRAAVERCIVRLIQQGELAGGVSVG